MRTRLLPICMLLLLITPARAGVEMESLHWEVALQMKKQKRVFHTIKNLMLPPSPAVKMRPRALVTLANAEKKTVAATLLRYSFSARLRRIGKPEEAGVWTVPFEAAERRVTRVKHSSTQKVPLYMNRVVLRAYLKRMYHAGYWPDAFRVQVMVEPRPGDNLRDRVLELELPVLWSINGNNHE